MANYSKIFQNKGLDIKNLITILTITLISFLFTACASKTLVKSQTATILIKTPTMKFYDKGFINIYEDHVYLQILSAGTVVLDLKVFKDEVCKDSLRCLDSKDFNKDYLTSNYDRSFLYDLLTKNQKQIVFRDRPNNILIKILKD